MMHKLYTVSQTRQIDQQVIAAGTSGVVLMKRAARAALDVLLTHWPQPECISVMCGSGNNGGDGYLLAALAAEQGLSVEVYAFGESPMSGDALRAAQYARKAGVPCRQWHEDTVLPVSGVLVDALLGTGSIGAPRQEIADAIAKMNDSGLPLLALDIPSGLDPDTGIAAGDVVSADVTVTFIALKRGLFTAMAPDVCGMVQYADLGVDEAFREACDNECESLCLEEMVEQHLPPRKRTAHKGSFGHVMVIGGDSGMGGAVILAAEAATRTGSGLTSAATQPQHVSAVLARRPEIMVSGVTSGQSLEPLLLRPSVLVIGPGLGRSAWSEQMLQQATLCGLPLVMDADALNILADGRVVRDSRRDNWILTPHPAEAARLLGVSTEEVQRDRFAAVRALQQRYGGVVVLKGAGSLVCGENAPVGICLEGNPGMATAGMGDVLAGIIGALCAQGLDLLDAARLGVCLHAEAADRVAELHGERGLIAGDLLGQLQSLVNLPQEEVL